MLSYWEEQNALPNKTHTNNCTNNCDGKIQNLSGVSPMHDEIFWNYETDLRAYEQEQRRLCDEEAYWDEWDDHVAEMEKARFYWEEDQREQIQRAEEEEARLWEAFDRDQRYEDWDKYDEYYPKF